MFWGITPAINLFDELPREKLSKQTINILIIGGCDARHILKTLAKKYQHRQVKLNFYVMEVIPEVYAKQILLLNLALQPVKSFGLIFKTRLFMEIYGNMLMRPSSARYLTQRAHDLIEMITNLDYMKRTMPNLNIDLKYKERDYIENVFKFWVSTDKFDVLDCWDRRQRKFLGVRYDTKNAAFDWDLHIKMHNVGAKNLNSQEYQSFRRNGVAFAWLESEVTRTNRSMVTGVIRNGSHFGHYGYLGDMQTGPFISYGVECLDEEFNKKTNNVYKYRSTDIAERNLREIFHEIEFRTPYEHKTTSSFTLGSTLMQIPEVKVVDTTNTRELNKITNECLNIQGVTINLVSKKQFTLWQHKEKFKQLFDIIYYANMDIVKDIEKEVVKNISGDKCVLIVESPLFSVSYRDKDLEEHWKKVDNMLEGVEKFSCPFDYKQDSYIKYILN